MRPAQRSTDARVALSALLASLGFERMAEDVRTEDDPDRLDRYARIILRQAPAARRPAILERFHALGLVIAIRHAWRVVVERQEVR